MLGSNTLAMRAAKFPRYLIEATLGRLIGSLILPSQSYTRSAIDSGSRVATIYTRNFMGSEKVVESVAFGDLNLEKIKIKTEDLKLLDGAMFRPRVSVECHKVVICFRGNTGTYEAQLDSMQRIADAYQVNVLGFNYRGVCQSEGRANNSGDLIADGRAAYLYAVNHLGYTPESCIFFGSSLGGGIAACLAAELHEKGERVYLFVDRSFISITAVLLGRVYRLWGVLSDLLKWICDSLLDVTRWQIPTLHNWHKIPSSHRAYVTVQGHQPFSTVFRQDKMPLGSFQAIQETVRRITMHKYDDPVITRLGSLHQGLEPRRRQKVAKAWPKIVAELKTDDKEAILNVIRRKHLGHKLFYPKLAMGFNFDREKLKQSLARFQLELSDETLDSLHQQLTLYIRSLLQDSRDVSTASSELFEFFKAHYSTAFIESKQFSDAIQLLIEQVEVEIDYSQSHRVPLGELISRYDPSLSGLDFLGELISRARPS